jgi:hypothetical protein
MKISQTEITKTLGDKNKLQSPDQLLDQANKSGEFLGSPNF